MCHSTIYRELASCGYCVVSFTHGDGSADYSPVFGLFEDNFSFTDYWSRNFAVKIREQEMQTVAKEFTQPSAYNGFGTDWKTVKLSSDIIFMGHSYGGITALGAVAGFP